MAQKLEKKSVLSMIFLTMITFGIYIPIWFINRKDALNALNSKEKISNIPIVFVLIVSIVSVILLIFSILFIGTSTEYVIDRISSSLTFIGSLTVLVISFKVRRIIQEHYKIHLSGVATFFFTFFYLQYKINRLLKIK